MPVGSSSPVSVCQHPTSLPDLGCLSARTRAAASARFPAPWSPRRCIFLRVPRPAFPKLRRQKVTENAAKIGEVNPFISAQAVIANIQRQLSATSLNEAEFPFFENPLLPSAQETPVTPNSLNLPSIDNNLISNTVNNSNYNNLSTAQKLAILFNQN